MERTFQVICGDALTELKRLPDQVAACIVTSPPYWGLRDYKTAPQTWDGSSGHAHTWGPQLPPGHAGPRNREPSPTSTLTNPEHHYAIQRGSHSGAFCSCGAWRGQLGLEPTPELYADHLVQTLNEARRVLREDGTLWLNLGDTYATGAGSVGESPGGGARGEEWKGRALRTTDHAGLSEPTLAAMGPMTQPNRLAIPGLKPKDLVGIPWRVAFALQAAGWWLRSEVIWNKPNPTPESARDRPSRTHEQLFLLARSRHYYYDGDAILEPHVTPEDERARKHGQVRNRNHQSLRPRGNLEPNEDPRARFYRKGGRNKRTVWSIATAAFPEAHFATFPLALVEPCIKAGSAPGGMVLDPFCGAGRAGVAALRLGRAFLGIELNPDYASMARRLIHEDASLLNQEVGDLIDRASAATDPGVIRPRTRGVKAGASGGGASLKRSPP